MATTGNLRLYRMLARAIAGHATNFSTFDVQEITFQADRHGIAPLLYRQFREGQISGLSGDGSSQLKRLAYAAIAHDMAIKEGTWRTIELLDSHGIPRLLLKGTPVSLLHYPDSHLRPRCDTDLFISESHVHETVEVLQENGYLIHGLDRRKHASRQFIATLPQGQRSFLHFDMHWKLNNMVLFRNSLIFDECWDEAQPVPALGHQAKALSDIDLLIHACIHRIAHGRNTERDRLIWLMDIHLIARGMRDELLKGFVEKAARKKVGVICADALRTTGELFGEAAPEHIVAQLGARRDDEPSAKLVNASRMRWALSDLAKIRGVRAKIGLAKEFFAPD